MSSSKTSTDPDAAALRRAIALALSAVRQGQTPFGSIIVRSGQILAAAHNTVHADCDATAHAEVNAIRAACRDLNTIKLTGATIYASCEPCPMCLSAIHWAGIERIVYGATISDAEHAGFNELAVPAAELARRARPPIEIRHLPLAEAIRPFELFRRRQGQSY